MSLGRWLRDRSRALERAFDIVHWFFILFEPVFKRVKYSRVEALIKPPEEWSKKLIFDCRMCGQCILHETGMTCPMTCPKNLRNGPCGGVRMNGNCEVYPEMPCVWVEAFERSQNMRSAGKDLETLQPPVNRQLEDRSAWITLLTRENEQVAPGWE